MLKFVNTTKKFVGGEVITTALNNINLEIRPGEYVAVTGPSGCGKTTLLSIIGMLDTPDGGEYWFDGKNVAGYREDQLNDCGAGASASSSRASISSRSCRSRRTWSWRWNTAASSAQERRERVAEMLEKLGVAHRAKPPSVAALGRPAATRGRGARTGDAPGRSARRRTHGQPRLRAWRGGDGAAQQINRRARPSSWSRIHPRTRRARSGGGLLDGAIA